MQLRLMLMILNGTCFSANKTISFRNNHIVSLFSQALLRKQFTQKGIISYTLSMTKSDGLLSMKK